jgi:hypothetical protein
MLPDRKSMLKPEANSERVNRFEAIWEKTEGTDLEKTLAMLQAYRDPRNWGTHSSAVRSVVKKYVGGMLGGGYCNTVKKKDALVFRIEFLFLLLSEEISFNHINPEGDLAAIFHVISTHTNINAYDFAQEKKLYDAYVMHKNEIKKGASTALDWVSVVKQVKPDHYGIIGDDVYDTRLVGAFLNANLIGYVDSWKLIVDRCGFNRLLAYNEHCTITDEDILRLFHSENTIHDHQYFIQYLYCKKYNLNFDNLSSSKMVYGWVDTVNVLCEATKEKNDGVLLLYVIKVMQKKGFLQPGKEDREEVVYDMLINLIEKRHLFENWNEIEEILFTSNNKINFIDFTCIAIERRSVDTVRYLLEEKKYNIDIKSLSTMPGLYKVFGYGLRRTPIQTLISALSLAHCNPSCYLETFFEILKILVSYDPDCVYSKDEKGNDIFYYWNNAKKLFNDFLETTLVGESAFAVRLKEQIQSPVDDFFEEGSSIIRNAFHRKRAFTFFQGKNGKDESNNISQLPNDVLGLICTYTIYSEILKRKENPDELINPENRAAPI